MNVFTFLSLHAGDSALLLIGKPVKRFMVNTAMTLLETTFESPAELYDLKPGVVYEIPNDYGYPNQFNVKNKSESSITPKIYVLEFGDVVRSSQPLPPPPPPPVVELDYIVADKLVKEYEVGQEVSYDDITVIAHYTDGSTADVSAEATIGTISTETAGDKTLSVCYSEDEITDCTGITIEVIEPEPQRELVYSEEFIEADITSDNMDIGASNWTNIKDRYYTYEFEYEITNNVGSNNSLRATNAMTSFGLFSSNISRTSKISTFISIGSTRTGKPFRCKTGAAGNSYHVKIWNLKIYLEAEDYVPLMLFAPDEP